MIFFTIFSFMCIMYFAHIQPHTTPLYPFAPSILSFSNCMCLFLQTTRKEEWEKLNNKKQRIRQASLLMLLNCILPRGKRDELI